MEDKIRTALRMLIEQGHKDFVIYPYGYFGKMTKKILNEEFDIKEMFIVDNEHSKTDSNIKNMVFLRDEYKERSFIILLAVNLQNWEISLSVHRSLECFAEVDRIADILSPSSYFSPWKHYEKMCFRNKMKILLIECIAREIYKNNIQGAIAEVGVFQGETAKYMNILFPDRKLYLFDTFSGFNKEDQDKDDERNLYNMKIDYSETSEEIVLEKMHFPKNCIIKKGWFPNSGYDINEKFALVRLDMDLYDPIYAGLKFFINKMQKGGYIIVHDCRSQNFDGAREALIDFCKENHCNYMCMPDKLGSAVICIGF